MYDAEKWRLIRAERSAAGLCYRCGILPVRNGYRTCFICALYQSEHNNARRQRFIKAGLCSKCGGTLTDTNYKMCERCRTYMYSHTLKYREGHANG